MKEVLYLAWCYLAYNKIKTVVLIAAVMITIYLPIGIQIIVSQSAEEFTSRARATPMLVGAKGSPLELVLNSLYFISDPPRDSMSYSEVIRVQKSGKALAIPLNTRFKTKDSPIVGTTLEYFELRNLIIADGRNFGILGECVLGANAAKRANANPGDYVLSTPESILDHNAYRLRMKVVGVLKPTGTADDDALFVDVKTTWVIDGQIHGHEESRPNQRFTEITKKNLNLFHFAGDPTSSKITAVIVIPHDEKSATQLVGRYLGEDEQVQIVESSVVMDDLLKAILKIRSYVIVAMIVLSAATLATMALVFTLSVQQRRREIETMSKIGGSRVRVAGVIVTEITSVFVVGVVLAGVLALLTLWYAPVITRSFVAAS